jgi:hypothetical protein
MNLGGVNPSSYVNYTADTPIMLTIKEAAFDCSILIIETLYLTPMPIPFS